MLGSQYQHKLKNLTKNINAFLPIYEKISQYDPFSRNRYYHSQPKRQSEYNRSSSVPRVLSNQESFLPSSVQSIRHVELVSLSQNGKNINVERAVMKYSAKARALAVIYSNDLNYYRLEIKKYYLKGLNSIEIDEKNSIIRFYCKCALLYKYHCRDLVNSQNMWLLVKRHQNYNFSVTVKNNQDLYILKEDKFCEELDVRFIKNVQQQIKKQEKDNSNSDSKNDEQPMFTQNRRDPKSSESTIKLSLKRMKEKDKIFILTDVFKIKKEPATINPQLKCPIFTCSKQFQQLFQLKAHIRRYHPELERNGIQISNFDGAFQYNEKALNLALYIGKMYPEEMKKIIKVMKTTE